MSENQTNITKSATTINQMINDNPKATAAYGLVYSVLHVAPDSDHLRSAIYKYGAVSVAIDASSPDFKVYNGSYVYGY